MKVIYEPPNNGSFLVGEIFFWKGLFLMGVIMDRSQKRFIDIMTGEECFSDPPESDRLRLPNAKFNPGI